MRVISRHRKFVAVRFSREVESVRIAIERHAARFAIICASFANATSTFSPVFADVNKNGASCASAALCTSAFVIAIWFFRSALFARNSIGTFPVTFITAATQSSRSSSVSFRVTSHTARTPWAPWKYASLSNSRKPFSPMISQIVMSTSMPPFAPSTLISFFETFAPSVEMYRSSNWSWMNLRIRHVLPTAPSPTRQTLTFIFWRSIRIPRAGASLAHVSGYKGVAHRLSIEIMAALGGLQPPMPLLVSAVPDRIGGGGNRLAHAGPGLRRREDLRRAVDRPHPAELFLAHDEPLGQVHLVPEEHHRDVADLLADHLDPVVEVVKGVLAREVADRDHALGALEVRVPEQGPEPFLAHDVPYHHVERRGGAHPHHVERLLRDLRADRGDVPVVELVLHEPLDEGGLADRDIPDETDLGLEMLLAGHRGCRHHGPPIERGLMYREDASIAPDNSSFFREHFSRVPLLRNPFGKGLERILDVDAGLRGREVERAVVGAGGLDHVVFANLDLVLQVDLVAEELDWNLAGHAVDALDPVVEVFEGLLPGDVAHRENPPSAVEVRFLEQLAEAFLAHDVPDRHVDLQLARAVWRRGRELLLGDLRPERLDVLVIEVLEHESADERGLANRGLAHEANFHFHPLDFHEEPPSNVA